MHTIKQTYHFNAKQVKKFEVTILGLENYKHVDSFQIKNSL